VPTEDAEGKLTHDTIAYSVRYAPIENRAAGYPALPRRRERLGREKGHYRDQAKSAAGSLK
jgi:hypothetical protein